MRVSVKLKTRVAPMGGAYGAPVFTPSYQEYRFSDIKDVNGAHDLGVTSRHSFQVTAEAYPKIYGAYPSPGFYHGEANAPVQWNNVGGDWADLNGVAQGTAPFATAVVAGSHLGESWVSWDIFNLVQQWLSGTPNAGLWLRGSNSNTAMFRSRFYSDATKRPALQLLSKTLGVVSVPCGGCMWVTTQETPLSSNPEFRCSGSASAGMLWFDLSPYAATDITAASLKCLTYDQYGASNVNVFRIVNPADQATIGPQTFGLAAKYKDDVGIENDPDVLFVQKFVDQDFEKLWMNGTDGSGGKLVTAPDGNGFSKLAGLYNGCKATTYVTNPPTNTNSALEAHWSPWRGAGQRLKPYEEVEELYLRYYLMFGLDWDPQPDGGKKPGFDSRYCDLRSPDVMTLLGMGRGNSGSGTDGMTGSSARCNYGRAPTLGDPLENARAMGSGDMYHADMTNTFGGDFGWKNHYLGHMRKGEWNCIEMYQRMNSVTDPTQIPRVLTSLSQVNGVATAILEKPETSPNYKIGQIWQIGGVSAFPTDAYHNFQGAHAITRIVDARTFEFSVPPSTSSPAKQGGGPRLLVPLCGVPSSGNYDGIVWGKVNGRLAGIYPNVRFRHARLRFDGGLNGIDAVWICDYEGGGAYPTNHEYSCYFANMIVARKEIGPMVH